MPKAPDGLIGEKLQVLQRLSNSFCHHQSEVGRRRILFPAWDCTLFLSSSFPLLIPGFHKIHRKNTCSALPLNRALTEVQEHALLSAHSSISSPSTKPCTPFFGSLSTTHRIPPYRYMGFPKIQNSSERLDFRE